MKLEDDLMAITVLKGPIYTYITIVIQWVLLVRHAALQSSDFFAREIA